MDPHTAGCVAARVARPRLGADPGAGSEVVVVALRQRDLDCVGDLAVSVGTERRPVKRLARLPGEPALTAGTNELLDLHEDVVTGTQAAAAHAHGYPLAGQRCERDARLRSVTPRPHPCVDAEEQARPDEREARVDGELLA